MTVQALVLGLDVVRHCAWKASQIPALLQFDPSNRPVMSVFVPVCEFMSTIHCVLIMINAKFMGKLQLALYVRECKLMLATLTNA